MRFELRGLCANNLQAFLALLGVLRVVDLQRPKWRARARWRNEAAGGLAEIEIEAADAVSESDFVAEIVKGARKLLASLAESIPETDAVEDAENPRAAFVGVFAASSPLFLSEKEYFRKKAVDLKKLQARDYEAALWNDWSYTWSRKRWGGLNWDPLDRREHARRHKEPASDKKFFLEKGGLALAICGWPSFMPAPKMQGKERKIASATPGWRAGMRKLPKESAKAEQWQADLSWPLWERFADLPEIEATLADHCWHADEIDRADMKARGVWQVMRAVRMRSREKSEASMFFGWAKPV